MTVKGFIQGIMLIFCMMVTSVILPIVLALGSVSYDVAPVTSAGPVFIFEEVR
jgi:hypothetical protein